MANSERLSGISEPRSGTLTFHPPQAPAHEQQHHSNRVSGTGGLRFRETVFLRPETQFPIGGPNNCCAVSET
jgi:hypothetical protein